MKKNIKKYIQKYLASEEIKGKKKIRMSTEKGSGMLVHMNVNKSLIKSILRTSSKALKSSWILFTIIFYVTHCFALAKYSTNPISGIFKTIGW